MHSVYRFISPSGKSYIGQTKRDPELRRSEHVAGHKRWVAAGRPRKGYLTKLFYAMDKYPSHDWTFKILVEGLSPEEVDKAEFDLINEYETVEHGYNTTAGGGGLRKLVLSDDHRKKQSEARKAYYETDAGKARKVELSERFKKNNIAKGRPSWNAGKKCPELGSAWRGKTFSAEHKAAIGAAHLGKPMPTSICPYCEKMGGGGAMKRFHFDNCKKKGPVGP